MGFALLIGGVLDIAVMVYCILNGISYSSSFNIFAVCLGILLMRGSLWAASFVRFFSAFFVAGVSGLIAVLPFFQPISLTLAELRHLSPFTIVVPLALLALSFWMVRELSRESVITALRSSGKSIRPLLFAIILGFGLAVAVAGGLALT